MISERVSIPVGDKGQVSGVLSVEADRQFAERTGVILAHGAGNDMEHPLLVSLSQGLADAGYITLRFNFLYREKGLKSPDAQNTLVLAWQSACRFLGEHTRYGTDMIIAAGKSMGGRVASQMVADGLLPVSRLVFLGYPLHPPGNKEKLRDAHLYRIKIPMLFFVGTRDRLCDLGKLKGVLGRLEADWDLKTIEGGDHSFRLPKSVSITRQDVDDRILNKTSEWLATHAERR